MLRRGITYVQGTMDRMLCTQCAAVSYSAAARTLVERGARCATCGAPLVHEPAEPAESPEPAVAMVRQRGSADEPAQSARRFERKA